MHFSRCFYRCGLHTHAHTLTHSQTMAFVPFLMLFMLHLIHFNSVYGTLPNPTRSTNSPYRNHPGKIENFTPGHSSATDKERREVCMVFFKGVFISIISDGNNNNTYNRGNKGISFLCHAGLPSCRI